MKQRKLEKRIASLVMVVVMLLSYIPIATWAVDTATDITAIQKPTGLSIVEDYDDYFGETWLDKLGLPAVVTVTKADGVAVDVPVIWDTSVLDTRTPGYYFLPGNVALPIGVTNEQNLKVSITIQVREKVNLLTNGNFETGYTGWTIASSILKNGTPAAVGNYALQVRSSPSVYSSFAILYPNGTVATELGTKVAAEGAGQYYIGAQVRDYVYDDADDAKDEIQHTDALQVCMRMGYKNNAADSFSYYGYSPDVTLSNDKYCTAGGVFDLTGEEVALSPRLYLKSAVKFKSQWILVDDFQFIPLKVALKVEPSSIAEIKTEIPSRFVAVDYDKYVGDDWQSALGLPEKVDVLTDKGETIAVDVTWDYSKLDVNTCGKYTLTGTLDASGCPNPMGLTVQQSIYVRKVENLLTNPGFESGLTGWSYGGSYKINGTPAAEGKYALQVRSSSTQYSSYNMLFTSSTTELATKVAAKGAGQYYVSAQVRDYLYEGETAHTDALNVYIRLGYKTNAEASSSSKGNTATVTLNSDDYVTTSGVFDLTGQELWLRPDLYMTSATKFAAQWILVDDMQFIPLNVLIPLGDEPADITEIVDEIPVRAVVQNYDKYVGEDWQSMLNLPSAVEVVTSKGVRANVNVTWDYSQLDLTKTGKYTLTGTLDATAYPNPLNLVVEQVIYIREYQNLITNPSFENGLTGWSYGASYELNGTPAAEGKYALQIKSSSSSVSSHNTLFVKDPAALAEKVVLAGAGQYYISAQVRDYMKKDEVSHTDALQAYIRVEYKKDPSASSSLKGTTQAVTLSNQAYVTTGGMFEMTGEEAWIRTNLYLKSATKFASQWVLVDDMQLVPLNVIVKQYDGGMAEVESVIPGRKIIQNYPSYIGDSYTVADLRLPETVDVRSTTGEVVTVGVSWNYSALNLSKVGTYTLTGTLEDMKLANPQGLTVKQLIQVVPYQNLIYNGSFEEGTPGWQVGYGTMEANLTKPVIDGRYSLAVNSRNRKNFASNATTSYQLIFIGGTKYRNMLRTSVAETGAGVYYYGVWAQAGETVENLRFDCRFLHSAPTTGGTSIRAYGNEIELSQTKYQQSSGFVELPGDTTFVRMDMYIKGENTDAIAEKKIYLDKAELIPLNVEFSVMTDIIDCGEAVNAYVHEGTPFEDLGLEKTLQVMIKTGEELDLDVIWNKNDYDPNKIGTQTITGTLNLAGEYTNPYGFAPTVQIIVRAKGEPLRETIYFSTSGDDANDGLSPNSPKQDVTKIGTYLAQGYNVRLKRGDTWYLPKQTISISGARATERAPLVLGAYGDSSKAQPALAFLLKIENSAWKLVDAKRNIWATDISTFSQYEGIRALRTFVDGEAYFHNQRINYVTLDAGECCDYDGMLYIRTEGEAPKNVEVAPASQIGHRINISNADYLTVEHLDFRGGSPINAFMHMGAPTNYCKVLYCNFTYISYYVFLADSSTEDIHYKLEVAYNYIDANLSVEEGADSRAGIQRVSTHEGIVLRQGVEEAWIHHNHLRNMSHSNITIEHLGADNNPYYTGVHNCVIEYNLCEGANACYARGFILGGQSSQKVESLSSFNIIRHNEFYDMDTASHLFGDHSAVYGNIFSYTHTRNDKWGEPMDGKGAQPWGIDTACYGGGSIPQHILVFNNTFFDVGGAVNVYDIYEYCDHYLIANNLVINYTSDNPSFPGGIYDRTKYGQVYIMNNGFYSEGMRDHIVIDNIPYTAEEANEKVFGCSGNLSGDPKFATADISIINGLGVRQNFALSDESPYRYAGLAWSADIWKEFPVWEKIQDDLTDVYGNAYLGESPSIGAVSYSQKVTGTVASVGALPEIAARTGATYDQLDLPATVIVTTEDGREIVLPISWTDAGFDSSKPGTCTLTATVHNGPHTDLTINGKTASITVNIKNRLEVINVLTNFSIIKLTVPYGTSVENAMAMLIDKVEVLEEGRFIEELPISWSVKEYDPYKPNYYTFEAKISDELITNSDDLTMEVQVRVLHELYRGVEILVNPDFIDGTSAEPWVFGQGTGFIKVTQDPQYLLDGEPAAVIVTADGRYGSIRQDVLGPMQLLGDGKYLYRFWMRAYDPSEPITSSYATIGITGQGLDSMRTNPINDIDTEWVQFYAIFDIKDIANATAAAFHTSTGKAEEDKGKSFIIAGCSLIFLGTTDEEVDATLDSINLDWNTIRGENTSEDSVMSDLTLPSTTGEASTIVWSSSNESVISNDGKVTMGRLPQTVTLTATVNYFGIETIKEFTVTVPRNPELPAYSVSISGNQTVKVGDEFQVVISVDSKNATAYNAYRFTLSFSTRAVQFISVSGDCTVELNGGQLVISGIGTEHAITDTITVTFKALKTGVTDVKMSSAQLDNHPDADINALPIMTVAQRNATITIEKGDAAVEVAVDSENNGITYIVIGVAMAILVCGGVIAWILIKKKKQTPQVEE